MTAKSLDFTQQPALVAELQRGLEQLQLAYTEKQQDLWLRYLTALVKWNRVYNLTAITEPKAMIRQHVLDSLSIAPFISADTCLDVGSGAGLPGIPLAILFPEKHWDLLDSQSKRIRFLTQVSHELGLDNVRPVHARVQEHQSINEYGVITARAFSNLADFVNASRHLLADGGVWLAMKGQRSDQECEQLPNDVKIARLVQLEIPGQAVERHLVILQPASKSK